MWVDTFDAPVLYELYTYIMIHKFNYNWNAFLYVFMYVCKTSVPNAYKTLQLSTYNTHKYFVSSKVAEIKSNLFKNKNI